MAFDYYFSTVQLDNAHFAFKIILYHMSGVIVEKLIRVIQELQHIFRHELVFADYKF